MRILLSTIVLLASINSVRAHGYLETPRSRNWVAHVEGGSGSGVPPSETCEHCLNTKAQDDLCSVGNAQNYDVWNDSFGAPMPWTPQAELVLGREFEVKAFLSTNHAGHMELKLCRYDGNTDQTCLDAHKAEFVRNNDGYELPKDPNYPERAYFADVGSGVMFSFTFVIPEEYEDIVGDKVLMQWHYITANNCRPEGYDEYGYLAKHGWLRSNSGQCSLPLSPTGQTGHLRPEQFWNCAEVSVRSPEPSVSPSPTVISASPSRAPVLAGPSAILTGYCTYGACDGMSQGGSWCNEGGKSRCECNGESHCEGTCNGKWCGPSSTPVQSPTSAPVTPVKSPTSSPVSNRVGSPTSAPVSTPVNGSECCFDIQQLTCSNCATSESVCNAYCGSNVVWMVPDASCLPLYSNCSNGDCCTKSSCVQNGSNPCPFDGSYCQCLK